MKRVMLAALAVIVLSGCDNRPDAPFGFKWGQSVEEIKKLNLKDIDCSEGKDKYKGQAFCTAKTSPDDKSEYNEYFLEFTENKGLFNIVRMRLYDKSALVNVKKIFEKLNNQIKNEYGKPIKINDRTDENVYFSCLADDSCEELKTVYKKGDIEVLIYLNNHSITVGYTK
ncbi:hypothetical protein QE177_04665 [Arsenophonus sp. aPb]|uniref:hypothetical protein n=1 Tax=Arsenophonus sp. aPb TaxID=3041619 RepID=UPI002468FFC6|nr:hypothetical protein [Arsenophonus sp. aPb]WGL99178.1 hypothetical protein QE177_04665 [Arsenophonus sp. aPb]